MPRRRSAPARSSITRRRGTIAGRTAIMSPPTKYPIKIAPSYLDELRKRVEAIGVVAVARAAGLARGSVWRQLAGGDDRKPTASAIESIRRAVVKLDPNGPPVPPPIVSVRGRSHGAWIAVADEIAPADLDRVIADAVKRYTRRK